MKYAFEIADCFLGIAIGVAMIGLSGKVFDIPEFQFDAYFWGLLFAVSFVFSLLDIKHVASDIGSSHIIMVMVMFLNQIVDAVIELGLSAKHLGFSVPYVSEYLNPFLEGNYLMYIGIFFVVASVVWLLDLART